jgi:flavin-binding protein dodecin
MDDNVYKTIEITGSSNVSIEEAADTAIRRAGQNLHSLRWFQVSDIRGHIEAGQIAHWQVTLKIGFTLDETDAEAG